MKKILIRADASVHIGSGHIMRCMVLAQALRKLGNSVAFACRPQKGDLIGWIKLRGFEVIELAGPSAWRIPKDDKDYQAWLQVPWQEDADSMLEDANDVDLLILDHYGINIEWEQYVKARLQNKLFVIDDLVRPHVADLLLDQTFLRDKMAYQSISSNARALIGCDYALLVENFFLEREEVLSRVKLINSFNRDNPRVLLSLGAMDLPNATLQVLEVFGCLRPSNKPRFTVLLGKNAPNYESVKDFCSLNSSWITHLDYAENMAALMTSHDLAIGAAGTTSWERVCLGLPSLIIPLADNQRTICQHLVLRKSAIKVELADIEDQLIKEYQLLLDNLSLYRLNCLGICDGLGVKRVLIELNNLFNGKSLTLSLRKAEHSDIQQVYRWQIQPKTRRFALNTTTPSLKEHLLWMTNQLAIIEHFFYIIVDDANNKDVGVVRLDRVGKAEYVISIFIDSAEHGKGYAGRALSLVNAIHSQVVIHATVLEENSASQQLFLSAGYKRVSKNTFIRDAKY
jgi:UDP-2,4-diacetamido-2,4,6-trideoxy-beta-L-altropyranose hydrolase